MENFAENFELERAIGFFINRAAYVMSEEAGSRFRALGYNLTTQDFGILFRLNKQDGLSQMQIADLMMRDKTTITRRLDGLVKKGLVERRMDENDRRKFCIHLTAMGIEAVKQLSEVVDGFQREVLSEISAEEKAMTIKVLQQITNKILTQNR